MKRFIKKYRGISLRWRLIISAVICVILPSVITVLLSNFNTKDELENRAVDEIENTLRLLDLNITNYLDDLLYVSNFIQFDDKINLILKENVNLHNNNNTVTDINKMKYIKISDILDDITYLLSPFYITIIMENGFAYTNYPKNNHDFTNLLDSKWINKSDNSYYYKTNWIGTHPSYIESVKAQYPYFISITKSLKLTSNTNAYTIISIGEREISNILNQFVSNEKQEFKLIDSNGMILSSQNEQEIQREFQYKDLVDNNRPSYHVVDYKNIEYFLVSYPLSSADWNLVSLVPYKETVGRINTITRSTLVMLFVFSSIFLIILIFLVRKLTNPISTLRHVTNKVEQGNLQVRSNIKGEGDIELLAQSFDNMLDEIEEMIFQIKAEEKSKRKAELEMLQAQINPHFLFNILNSLRLKITMNGDKDSARLIQSLSSLLRKTINRNNEFIPLYEEIEIVDHYVQLMNFRRNGHVEISSNLASDTLMLEIPRLFLQPLIENAIIHGFNQKGGTITITSWLEENIMLISIKDNGKGIDDGKLHEIRRNLSSINAISQSKNKASFNGIGISNVYQRLLMTYGKEFRMEIDSQQNKGTEIKFYIPRIQGVLRNV
ncbi:hypothetical protein CWR48_02840 [Oceanobacillus arenosus]|uniref:HAMP domain-containing protein n=1 Tax=Oceanobacillus arenosus TaxID=1229153 RepID=A0A3D8Q1S7_9BACI|nr:sensor histidine kinase [Oceanobacillus arenosus]RDW21359.1 hypothetical protein CWR48_02840 [Oceanobacillus arenosus]